MGGGGRGGWGGGGGECEDGEGEGKDRRTERGRGEWEEGKGGKQVHVMCLHEHPVCKVTHTPWFSCHDFHRSSDVISRSVSWNRWLFSEPSCSSVWRNCRGREMGGKEG